MTTIRRLADSCLTVSTDDGTSLIDPGFFTFGAAEEYLSDLGEVQRVLITHEHGDHVKPEFVRWLIDRGDDVQVFANDAVRSLLAAHDIEVEVSDPDGVSSEDCLHGVVPNGDQPTNRSYTVGGVLTHPGDSHEPASSGAVLALPCMVPWGSMTESIKFAKRLEPQQVIPIHDFYLSSSGRDFVTKMATNVLAGSGIEVVPLGWGESFTV